MRGLGMGERNVLTRSKKWSGERTADAIRHVRNMNLEGAHGRRQILVMSDYREFIPLSHLTNNAHEFIVSPLVKEDVDKHPISIPRSLALSNIPGRVQVDIVHVHMIPICLYLCQTGQKIYLTSHHRGCNIWSSAVQLLPLKDECMDCLSNLHVKWDVLSYCQESRQAEVTAQGWVGVGPSWASGRWLGIIGAQVHSLILRFQRRPRWMSYWS